MDKLVPLRVKVARKAPDLTVDVVPSKSIIIGGGIDEKSDKVDSMLVTITARNRWSIPPVIIEEPNTLPVFGSDAKNVLVLVELPQQVRQVGGILGPTDFSVAILPPNNKTLAFYGGTICAGESADFVIEIVAGGCGEWCTISAIVDPFNAIHETTKDNNIGRASIFIDGICEYG